MRKFLLFLITGIILFAVFPIAAHATDTETLSALINKAPTSSSISLEPNKLYVITEPIIISKPINIDLMDSTIICKNSRSVLIIQADNITIKNGVLDLNYTTHNGIIGSGHNNLVFENLVIKDLLPSATNLQGGIYLKSCKDIYFNRCSFKNILNYADPGSVDHSPAIKLISCNNSSINQFYAENCGVGINSYGSKNITVSDFNMLNINNNGFYIQNDSKNINIKNGKVDGAENGLVFNLTNYSTSTIPTTVSCIDVEFNRIINKGVSLRNGSGLAVSKCSFSEVRCVVGQSSNYNGCSNIIIAENIIKSYSSKQPFFFKNNTLLSIRDNSFI